MRPWIGIRAAKVARRFAADENYRNAALVRLQANPHLFQPDNYTEEDRYPELFQEAARRLADIERPKVLSFGCSTGEEVFTLRSHLPTAQIKGLDISRWNIAVCQRKLRSAPDEAVAFQRAGTTLQEPDAAYDAIFCMAVLRRGRLTTQRPERCDPHISFARFETCVTDLSRCLRVGGLLFIEHSNFRFGDLALASDFETIARVSLDGRAERYPIYGRDNRLLADAAYGEVGFRKLRERGCDSGGAT